MIFLSVLIVFILLQVWGKTALLQNDAWLVRLREMAVATIGEEKQSYLVVMLPVLVVGLIVSWFSNLLFGLVGLAIYVIVLLYSLGRGDLTAALNKVIDAWQRGDKQSDVYIANEWGIDVPDDCDENELHQMFRARFTYLSLERWFIVLFWFVFFGPAGALLYRLCRLEQDRGQAIEKVVHYLEWVPVRLFGLSCSLVGDFSNCIEVFRRAGLEADVSSDKLADDYVVAALRLDVSGLSDSDHDMRSQAIIEWSEVQGLIHRCVVVWMVVIAILAIF